MHLEIKQANDRTEQVSSTCIDKLYNLSKNDLLDATSDLRGNINAASAYEDAVTFLNTMWGPNLIVTASAYYIRFADEEVVNALISAGVMQEGEGLTTTQAEQVSGSLDTSRITSFDELIYFKYWNKHGIPSFNNRTLLESIDLTNLERVNSYQFRNCNNLKWFHGKNNDPYVLNLVNFKSFQSTSAYNMFTGCVNLKHVLSFGDSITYFPNNTFGDCTALEDVVMPITCVTLGAENFIRCSALTTVNISHVTTINANVFNGCSSLEYCDGPNSTQGELNLPNLTGTLDDGAFKGCTKLTSIASLGSITSIGSSAFENCTNLATINFPSTITSVGANAFNNTAWYNSQPNGPVYVEKALYKCKNASGVLIIPNNITSITETAFYDCSSLTSVTIGSSVASIGVGRIEGIFKGCTALSTIVVDSNNATYDSRDNCNAIIETASNKLIACCKNSTFLASLNSLGSGCFKQSPKILDFTDQNSGLSNINITNVDATIFQSGNFEEVYFPDTVTTVTWGAFQFCKSLKKVDFGSGITSFGGAVFHGTQLSPSTADITVVIRAITPPSIDTSANNTFNYSAVHHIQVPASVVQTYKDVWGNAGLPVQYLNMIEPIPTT